MYNSLRSNKLATAVYFINKTKKHHEEGWGKNTMETKTWMWIYKTDTTQDSTVKNKRIKENFTAVNQTTG